MHLTRFSLLLLLCAYVSCLPVLERPLKRKQETITSFSQSSSSSPFKKQSMPSSSSKHRLNSSISNHDHPLAPSQPFYRNSDPSARAASFQLYKSPSASPVDKLSHATPRGDMSFASLDLGSVEAQFEAMVLTPTSLEVERIDIEHEERRLVREYARNARKAGQKLESNLHSLRARLDANRTYEADTTVGKHDLQAKASADRHEGLVMSSPVKERVGKRKKSNFDDVKQDFFELSDESDESDEVYMIRSHSNQIGAKTGETFEEAPVVEINLTEQKDPNYAQKTNGVRGDIEEWKRSRSNTIDLPVFGGSLSAFKAVKGKERRYSE